MRPQIIKFLAVLVVLCLCGIEARPNPPKGEFYEIRIYTISGKDQEAQVDAYLRDAFLPALHRSGISKVGVFKPVKSDTTYYGKRIYVVIPFSDLDQFASTDGKILKDADHNSKGASYLQAPYNNPPYIRFESIISKAFPDAPKYEVPLLKGPIEKRVYELRSYEGPTEAIFANKVKMFNAGGEIILFKRLNFNAVFYSEVIAGKSRPNLMYMTSFEDMASRDQHWKDFVASPEWKTISTMAEYQHNMSKMEIFLLHPTPYSDL